MSFERNSAFVNFRDGGKLHKDLSSYEMPWRHPRTYGSSAIAAADMEICSKWFSNSAMAPLPDSNNFDFSSFSDMLSTGLQLCRVSRNS